MKLSDLRSASEIHEENMRDPEYRREYERTKLANDVAIRVLAYRTEHGMSQTQIARKLGMRQPNIARLESGEHEPSLSTLARLSSVLEIDFSVEIKPGGLKLRPAPRSRKKSNGGFAITEVSVPGKARLAKDAGHKGGYVLADRGGSRVRGDVPPQGAGDHSRKSLKTKVRAVDRQARRRPGLLGP